MKQCEFCYDLMEKTVWQCATCFAVQPWDDTITPFRLLNIAPHITVDEALLEKNYKTLLRDVHPDSHMNQSPQTQAQAALIASKANKAYDMLRDCKSRFLCLWSILNKKNGFEEVPLSTTKDVPFLMRIMELQEQAADALIPLEEERDRLLIGLQNSFEFFDLERFEQNLSRILYLKKLITH